MPNPYPEGRASARQRQAKACPSVIEEEGERPMPKPFVKRSVTHLCPSVPICGPIPALDPKENAPCLKR